MGNLPTGFLVLELIIAVVIIAAYWKLFTKAGEAGWASIIPIYGAVILLQIAGRPAWWFFLYLIPLVNIVIHFIVSIDLANRFGKDSGFGVGIAILPFIFLPILAFGDAEYEGHIEPAM